MTNKKVLIDTLEYLNEEQSGLLLEIINTFSNRILSKRDLMKISDSDQSGVDSALPMNYTNAIQDIHPNFKTMFHVYDYTTNTYGELKNVAEAFVLKLNEVFTK